MMLPTPMKDRHHSRILTLGSHRGLKRQAAALGLASAMFGIAQGCAVAPETRPVQETKRIIAEEPSEFFHRDSIIDRDLVTKWDLGKTGERGIWKVSLSESEYAWTSNGLEVDAEQRFFSLTAVVGVDASTVDVCEVTVHDLYKKPITVSWAAAGEPFSKEARITTDSPVWSEGLDERYRLVLKGHPKWSGKVERLKIGFVIKRTNIGRINSIALSKERMKGDAAAELTKQAWRFEIDNEVRSGWFGVPNIARNEVVQIPRRGRLLFAMGSLGRCSEDPVFKIVLTDRERTETILFNEPYAGEHGTWQDREIDVSAWGGQQVELRFETANLAEREPDIPVWGNPVLVAPGEKPMPNIVLIDLDTLRADHLSIYGYDRPTTPKIDAWTKRSASVVFEKAVAAAPWTLPSHVSIFTAIDAHKHGVNQNKPMPPSMLTLAEVLRDAGYTTFAVTGGGFVHSSFGFAQGFDEYRSFSSRMGFDDEIQVTTKEALKKLERHRETPFFLFYHTYEIHNPYRPRLPGLKEISGRETDFVIGVSDLPRRAEDGLLTHRELTLGRANGERFDHRPDDFLEMAVDLYDAGIAYADSFVDQVVSRIEELGLANNTIVVITSDHGELFGENNEFNHYCVYDGNVYVPLIISAPGVSKEYHRVQRQVRSIDLMPTLLDLAGLQQPEGIDGVTLREAVEGGQFDDATNPALSYAAGSNFGMSVRDNGMTYIMRNGAWSTEMNREEFLKDGAPFADWAQVEAFADLRKTVGPALEESLPGLRVIVSNIEGSEEIEGVFSGPLTGVGNVKIFDLDSGILSRLDDGSAHFSLEPGRRVSLIFEGSEPAPLFLKLGGRHFTFRIEEGQPIQRVSLSGKGWSDAVDSDAVSGDGVFLWRVGANHSVASPQAVSDELKQQLEALGYVE